MTKDRRSIKGLSLEALFLQKPGAGTRKRGLLLHKELGLACFLGNKVGRIIDYRFQDLKHE